VGGGTALGQPLSFARLCRASAFPPCGRLMLPVPLPVLHGMGFHGDLAPDESFGAVFYRFTARPPLNPVVVGHKKLGPA
jgi:hypothetical protein